jgi:hypothetical protein
MQESRANRVYLLLIDAMVANLKKLPQACLLLFAIAATNNAPAFSQEFSVQAGVNTSSPSVTLPILPTPPGLPPLPVPPGLPGISFSSAGSTSNGLPVCNLDSFVHQAGMQAESIYGDEGLHTKPSAFGFSQSNRINAGISGQNDAGLTTGHGSYMPDANGADEFIMAPNGEWGPTGPGSGAYYASMPPGVDDGPPDTTQTKELPNSAAGYGLVAAPVNGQLSLTYNAATSPWGGSEPGLTIGVSGGGGSVSVSGGGVSVSVGTGGVSVSVSGL